MKYEAVNNSTTMSDLRIRKNYDFLAFALASRAIALSAKSTPTKILEAFHNCTKLIMFFRKHMGKLTIAATSGHVRWERDGRKAEYGPKPIGVWTHFIK